MSMSTLRSSGRPRRHGVLVEPRRPTVARAGRVAHDARLPREPRAGPRRPAARGRADVDGRGRALRRRSDHRLGRRRRPSRRRGPCCATTSRPTGPRRRPGSASSARNGSETRSDAGSSSARTLAAVTAETFHPPGTTLDEPLPAGLGRAGPRAGRRARRRDPGPQLPAPRGPGGRPPRRRLPRPVAGRGRGRRLDDRLLRRPLHGRDGEDPQPTTRPC